MKYPKKSVCADFSGDRQCENREDNEVSEVSETSERKLAE
jgi:hypothetical protein